jgi:hypothetical protein
MVDISKEHAVETFKSLILVSLQGLKLLAIFNSGAAVALLAYLGNVAGKGMPVPNMRLPMVCYVVGLIACGLAFFFGYLTQFRLYNESMDWSPQRQHVKHQVAGIIFALLSLVAFSVGSCVAAWRFSSALAALL